jgi:hypothetical protein
MALCSGKKRTTGEPCRKHAVHGATVCRYHGGSAPQVRAKAAVRAEVLAWQVGTPLVDPGETLLRMVTQSWTRADQLAARLDELVAANGGDLHAALIGDTIILDPQNGREVKSGEYIRGLAQLEAAERERCASWSAKAIAAGLAKRQVELAERHGQLLAELLRAVLNDPELALTADQRKVFPDVSRRHLHLVAS